MASKFTRDYFEKRLNLVSEQKRYSSRLLDTYFFTISAAGIYFCVMFKQWILENCPEKIGELSWMIYTTSLLFLLVILLNLIGQAISRDIMKAEEDWCREELDGLMNLPSYSKSDSDKYDKKGDRLSAFIRPIIYAYNLLFFAALLLGAIIFIIV